MSIESWPRIEVKPNILPTNQEYIAVSVSSQQRHAEYQERETDSQEAEEALKNFPPENPEISQHLESKLKTWKAVNVWGLQVQQKNGEIQVSTIRQEKPKMIDSTNHPATAILKMVLKIFGAFFWWDNTLNRVFNDQENKVVGQKPVKSSKPQEAESENVLDKWLENGRVIEGKKEGGMVIFEYEGKEYSFKDWVSFLNAEIKRLPSFTVKLEGEYYIKWEGKGFVKKWHHNMNKHLAFYREFFIWEELLTLNKSILHKTWRFKDSAYNYENYQKNEYCFEVLKKIDEILKSDTPLSTYKSKIWRINKDWEKLNIAKLTEAQTEEKVLLEIEKLKNNLFKLIISNDYVI